MAGAPFFAEGAAAFTSVSPNSVPDNLWSRPYLPARFAARPYSRAFFAVNAGNGPRRPHFLHISVVRRSGSSGSGESRSCCRPIARMASSRGYAETGRWARARASVGTDSERQPLLHDGDLPDRQHTFVASTDREKGREIAVALRDRGGKVRRDALFDRGAPIARLAGDRNRSYRHRSQYPRSAGRSGQVASPYQTIRVQLADKTPCAGILYGQFTARRVNYPRT